MNTPASGHWSDPKTFEEYPVSVGDDLVAVAWEVQFQGSPLLSNIKDVAEQYRSDGHPVEDLVRRSDAVSKLAEVTAANNALVAERTSIIAAKREQLAVLTAERDELGRQIERMEYSGGDAEHWRHLATTAEAQLKAAHEALQQAFDFLGGIDGAVGVRASVAAALEAKQ